MKLYIRILSLVFTFVYINQAAKASGPIGADTLTKPNLTIGKTLPQFTLQTPDGTAIKMSSVKGKVVLVDFWASWCMPCRASIPHLKQLYQKYHADGFEILSVSIDQNNKAWKNAMLKEAMPWPQVIDHYDAGMDASTLMLSLGIASVPFVMMLDDEGKVVTINPAKEETDDQLKKIFKH
ncbi:TlpA family protein disulfide reductase [Mucilaginibacter paludis]|uniref:Redoxin domain protein n=1 Tax=Mucilaginibacter paludis DSM 18603 TaxID=714943 RepID=H1Y2M0_9SPHI|nr:TlpA disulfide reductase family protein [Mucilaginibacter paludis]EHQ28068.1 Redoxin domain protein [Mucilaginibacter paludis DSM 18603]